MTEEAGRRKGARAERRPTGGAVNGPGEIHPWVPLLLTKG